MKQNDFYEVDGCIDFIPVKLIKEHKYINLLEVEVTGSGSRTFTPGIYKFPKVQEQQKVVVPKFIDIFIGYAKAEGMSLFIAMDNAQNKESEWIITHEETFARAWLDDYEIEPEKLYTVEIPNPNKIGDERTILMKNGFNQIVTIRVYDDNWRTAKGYQLTEVEIRKDFEWAWQWAKEAEV